MKNKILLFVSILLAAALLLSACGPKEESSSINLPAVSVGESAEESAPPNQASGAYPAGEAVQSASSAYPAGVTAVINRCGSGSSAGGKIRGHHVLDWVHEKLTRNGPTVKRPLRRYVHRAGKSSGD